MKSRQPEKSHSTEKNMNHSAAPKKSNQSLQTTLDSVTRGRHVVGSGV